MTSQASSSGWAIRVETVRPVSAGALTWRGGGDRWAVTVVVKATFSIVDDGAAELIAPAPLCLRERLAGAAPDRFGSPAAPAALLEEPDLAPYKPQVDVTFVGSVHAARPVQALRARLAVLGDGQAVDKSIQAVGDRAAPGAAPLPFRQMPLGWERTWASPDNPAGVVPGGGAQPNLIDPVNASSPVGLGPIARAWPPRARLLGSLDRRWIEARIPELPLDFRWEYFQAAPRDQRLARLRGAETILLENLLEGRPRVRTSLPSARACARLHAGWTPAEGQILEMAADTLAIDGDAQTISIVWRASVPLPRAADVSLEGAHVVTGVELPGFPMPWPSPRSAPRAAGASSRPGPPPGRLSSPAIAAPPLAPPSAPATGTLALTPEDAMRLLASAPRHTPFPGDVALAVPPRSLASTLPSPGAPARGLDPPTRPLPIAVVAPPPPPPAAEPPEEATRQMALGNILDESTAAIHLGPPPATAPPRAPAATAPSTMALTPEQASAMLAAAGRQIGAGGGFPPPLVGPLGPSPAPPPPTPPGGASPAPPARVAPPAPPVDDDVDTTGETFALTPEQAQQMMAEAARKNRR